jgi:hypothetical protein
MIKPLAVLVFVILSGAKIFSQSDKSDRIIERAFNNRIGIEVGYDQGYLKDQIFSLLNYSQGGILVGLNYLYYKPNGNYRVQSKFSFGSGNLKTNVSDFFESTYIAANFQLDYLRKLSFIKKERLCIYVGAQYRTQVNYFDWNDLSTFSYLATHGIAIKALGTYQLSTRSNIQSSVSIPFFQSLVRPPYNGIDEFVIANTNNLSKILFTGNASSFNKYLSVNWHSSFRFDISKRFELMVSYSMLYQRVFDDQKFIQLKNQFTIGTNFKF